MYPKCNVMLIKYVENNVTPLLKDSSGWEDMFQVWEEAVEDDKNLVDVFSHT
jgi:hypothetical protein